MPFQSKVSLPGSERTPLPGSTVVGSVDPNQIVDVSVILRHKGGQTPDHRRQLSHQQFAAQHGADPAHVDLVAQLAAEYGLTVVDTSLSKRRVTLRGTLDAFTKAFEAELQQYQTPGGEEFRGRTGTLCVPPELQPTVIAILGLDSRRAADPHFRVRKKSHILPLAAAQSSTFTAPQVAQLYNYPGGADGSGQTIGIVELGGGYTQADLDTYFSGLSLNTPSITAVSVDGGANTPGGSADGEVMLDIEVAGGMAPGAAMAVYFAPNTDQGFVDAVTDAAHDATNKPSVISISWGGSEDGWTQQGQAAMNAALQDAATLGVTVTIAAGDNGSTDGAGDGKLHVDFPASSPYALACGGTTLAANGSTIASETVWNEIANSEGATGGGVSNIFPVPTYQANAGIPAQPQTNFAGRGVPDIAGVADPTTGYQIVFGGQSQVVGGTSAVAPQWAALVAILNQKLGKPVGYVNAALYAITAAALNDITTGNNDDSNLGYYSAAAGWDPCTGLGSPNGAAILSALQSSSTASSGQ